MNSTRICHFATAAITVAATVLPIAAHAELRSKSGEIVVMEPQNLPEAAQAGGNSFFLHSTDSGSYYLYVEQQNGARMAVFDVTNPAHVKTVSVTPLQVSGSFNFVRPLDYQVVDISTPGSPALLTTVKHVKRQVANNDMGTTFLLGSDGLPVVRRLSVENDYATHQIQLSGN